MCGICGRVSLGQAVNLHLLRRMNHTLRHRGPDEEGYHVDGRVGLAACRLSIVDLERGHQPVSNEDGTVWVVFNGEIYNYPALRASLINKGHLFVSHCDTEVLVHLYETEGLDFIHSLRGMFAIGLWDKRKQQLVLARDRIGIKPLYYAVTRDAVLFGSEIKAVVADAEVDTSILPDALAAYLLYSYIPEPTTIYKGVESLLPGHLLVWQEGTVSFKQYWDVPACDKAPLEETSNRTDAFRHLLADAVESHLIGDVPVGAFLSGGLDSSALAGIMVSLGQAPRTFSAAFQEPSYCELKYAQTASAYLGTQHQSVEVTSDILDSLPRMLQSFDQPFADSSAVPVYYLAQLASQSLKVVITGDGADEILAGYDTYLATSLSRYYRLVPRPVQQFIRNLSEMLPVSNEKMSLDMKARRFAAGASFPLDVAHLWWRIIFEPAEIGDLLSSVGRELVEEIDIVRPFRQILAKAQNFSFLDRLLYFDLKAYLPNDMLVKVDRMTMAHSLEARVPYLDHILVEFAFALPPHLKRRGLQGKRILRQAMDGLLPPTIRHRKKAGFNVPLAQWLQGPLKRHVEDALLSDSPMMQMFKKQRIESLLREHWEGRRDYSHKIWALFMLELWYNLVYKSVLQERQTKGA